MVLHYSQSSLERSRLALRDALWHLVSGKSAPPKPPPPAAPAKRKRKAKARVAKADSWGPRMPWPAEYFRGY